MERDVGPYLYIFVRVCVCERERERERERTGESVDRIRQISATH